MVSTSEMKSKMSGLVLLPSSWEDMTGWICFMNTEHAKMVVRLEYPWPMSWGRKKQRITSVKATKVSPPRIGMIFAVIPTASGGVDRSSAGASVLASAWESVQREAGVGLCGAVAEKMNTGRVETGLI